MALTAISRSGGRADLKARLLRVGEIKKQRYVYYHCTDNADSAKVTLRPGAASICGRTGWMASSRNC